MTHVLAIPSTHHISSLSSLHAHEILIVMSCGSHPITPTCHASSLSSLLMLEQFTSHPPQVHLTHVLATTSTSHISSLGPLDTMASSDGTPATVWTPPAKVEELYPVLSNNKFASTNRDTSGELSVHDQQPSCNFTSSPSSLGFAKYIAQYVM